MNTIPLDIYDDMPPKMKKYISNYRWRFTKKSYEYACQGLYKINKFTKTKEYVIPYTKEEVDAILAENGITIEDKSMYDYVYVATMCKADYLGSAIEDNRHLAMFIKDTVEDVDASNETTFRRWVATRVGNGQPIDWGQIC